MLGNLPLHNRLQWLKLFDNITKFLQQRLIHLGKNWKINGEFGDEIKKAKRSYLQNNFYKPSWDLKSLCCSRVDFKATDVISNNELSGLTSKNAFSLNLKARKSRCFGIVSHNKLQPIKFQVQQTITVPRCEYQMIECSAHLEYLRRITYRSRMFFSFRYILACTDNIRAPKF
jgi:hypothetical protein